jgi:hypothetical protein
MYGGDVWMRIEGVKMDWVGRRREDRRKRVKGVVKADQGDCGICTSCIHFHVMLIV